MDGAPGRSAGALRPAHEHPHSQPLDSRKQACPLAFNTEQLPRMQNAAHPRWRCRGGWTAAPPGAAPPARPAGGVRGRLAGISRRADAQVPCAALARPRCRHAARSAVHAALRRVRGPPPAGTRHQRGTCRTRTWPLATPGGPAGRRRRKTRLCGGRGRGVRRGAGLRRARGASPSTPGRRSAHHSWPPTLRSQAACTRLGRPRTLRVAPAAPHAQHVHVGGAGVGHQGTQLGGGHGGLEDVGGHHVGAWRWCASSEKGRTQVGAQQKACSGLPEAQQRA